MSNIKRSFHFIQLSLRFIYFFSHRFSSFSIIVFPYEFLTHALLMLHSIKICLLIFPFTALLANIQHFYIVFKFNWKRFTVDRRFGYIWWMYCVCVYILWLELSTRRSNCSLPTSYRLPCRMNEIWIRTKCRCKATNTTTGTFHHINLSILTYFVRFFISTFYLCHDYELSRFNFACIPHNVVYDIVNDLRTI